MTAHLDRIWVCARCGSRYVLLPHENLSDHIRGHQWVAHPGQQAVGHYDTVTVYTGRKMTMIEILQWRMARGGEV